MNQNFSLENFSQAKLVRKTCLFINSLLVSTLLLPYNTHTHTHTNTHTYVYIQYRCSTEDGLFKTF